MYSESDIEHAVASGAITPAAASALRRSVADGRSTSSADEESFRLLTGFNDIFVSIAALLLLAAVGWIGGTIGFGLASPSPVEGIAPQLIAGTRLGAVLIAAASWGLAEYFTRRRRMALPSILLLLAFDGSVGAVAGGAWNLSPFAHNALSQSGLPIGPPLTGVAMAIAAYIHWRRFQVPITIAALTGALVLTAYGVILAALTARPACAGGPFADAASCVTLVETASLWLALVAGVAVFAFAMWWDMSDRARITRRSDVAFWLHLGAAPLIAHSVFALLGVTYGEPSAAKAVTVVALYLLFGAIALATDRRALLVSSLIYVLYALSGLFAQVGAASLNMALTALIIGSFLLMLSAFWHGARGMIVRRLPDAWRLRLPELDRAPAPQRAP